MAQTFDFNDKINFPAEVVFKKIIDLKFVEDWTIVQDGLNPKAEIVKEDDKEITIKLVMEEPLPIGTQKSTMFFTWNKASRKSTWDRKGEGMGSKAKVYGTSEIMEDGPDACKLVDHGTMNLPIPIIGKKLEKQVVEHMKKGRAKKINYFIKALEADAAK